MFAVLFFGYAYYGLHHDLYVSGRYALVHFHGPAARVIVFYLLAAAVLWGLNALLGNHYDKEDHPVLNIVGQCLIYFMWFLWVVGVFVNVCTPKEKPIYHTGDPIVLPSSGS